MEEAILQVLDVSWEEFRALERCQFDARICLEIFAKKLRLPGNTVS